MKLDFETIRKHIDELELLDNTYFHKDRGAKMRGIYDKVIKLLDDDIIGVDIEDKKLKRNIQSEYYYLKGKTLDFMPEFQKDAEELLSKAVKLRPSWLEPIRALAHVYWK